MPVDSTALEQAVRDLGIDLAIRLADQFVNTARRGVSRRTGELDNSIYAEAPIVGGDIITVPVHAASDHARYQNEGTGIYGPEGRPITSLRPGGVLRFDWPAAGGIVFARSVQGSPGTHFWDQAIDAWSDIVRTV